MYLSTEDARSDFILTVAAVVLGRYAFDLIAQIPGYPTITSDVGVVLVLVWQVLLTGATPWLLARYRNDVPRAFAFATGDRGSPAVGLVLAAPLLVAHLLPVVFRGDVGAMLLALTGRLTASQPTLEGFQFSLDLVWQALSVLILMVGTWLFTSFLAVRARDAFRSRDVDLTELVRTFGMGGVGVSLVLGLLVWFRGFTLTNALLVSGTLLVVVLLTDQYVPARTTTTRATVLGPVIAVAVLHVLAAGGLFSGDLLLGLYFGVAAAVVTLCAVALAEVRQGWAVMLLVMASVLYPIPVITQPLPCTMVLCF
jgi:hypothetical protein